MSSLFVGNGSYLSNIKYLRFNFNNIFDFVLVVAEIVTQDFLLGKG